MTFFLSNGIGQNFVAGGLTVVIGFAWSKTKYWPLHMLHVKLDALHDRHDEHRGHIKELSDSLSELHDKVDRLNR